MTLCQRTGVIVEVYIIFSDFYLVIKQIIRTFGTEI